jgi:2-dehydropantoate 2-reductase
VRCQNDYVVNWNEEAIVRIGIMAAGALGGYYGARLAAAGHDVVFFARGAQLTALRDNGLRLESPLGDLHLPRVNASGDPASAGQMDVVLFAVKLWDTEKAAQDMRPIVGEKTRVISLQNGVDSVAILQSVLGQARIIGGSAYMGGVVASPGVIRQTTKTTHIVCGPPDARRDDVLEAFASAAGAANIEVRISEDINRDLWQKFVFLVGLSGSTASTRQNLGPVLADPDTRKLFIDLVSEATAVGLARGVALAPDLAERTLAFASTFPPGHRASTLNDLERGNRLELDWLTGRVVSLGAATGVATPVSAAVYAMLKPYRMGKPA